MFAQAQSENSFATTASVLVADLDAHALLVREVRNEWRAACTALSSGVAAGHCAPALVEGRDYHRAEDTTLFAPVGDGDADGDGVWDAMASIASLQKTTLRGVVFHSGGERVRPPSPAMRREVTVALRDGLNMDMRRALRRRAGEPLDEAENRLYEAAGPYDPNKPDMTIYRVPPGTGKTWTTMMVVRQQIAEHLTVRGVTRPDGTLGTDANGHPIDEGYSPFVLCGPTYQQLYESSAELRDVQVGLDGRETPKAEPMRDLDGNALAPVTVDYLAGKERSGCLRAEEVAFLSAQGLPTNELCRNTRRITYAEAKRIQEGLKKGGEPDAKLDAQIEKVAKDKAPEGRPDYKEPVFIEVFCEHYKACPFQRMIRRLNADPFGDGYWIGKTHHQYPTEEEQAAAANPAQVIVTPHSNLSRASLPLNAHYPRLAIIDESTLAKQLGQLEFPLAHITPPNRRPPRLTKQEQDEGWQEEDLLADYEKMVEAAVYALENRLDVPTTVLKRAVCDCRRDDAPWTLAEVDFTWARAMISVAVRVAYASCAADRHLDPDLTERPNLERLRKAVWEEAVSPSAAAEHRMWRIVLDRVEELQRHVEAMKKLLVKKEILKSPGQPPWMNEKLRLGNPDVYEAAKKQFAARSANFEKDFRENFADAVARLGDLPEAKKPKRDRDIRIQLSDRIDPKTGSRWVELAWREKFVWANGNTNVILLDASADKDLYIALYGDAFNIRFVDLSIGMRMRTVAVWGLGFSNASLLPPTAADAEATAGAGAALEPVAEDGGDPIEDGEEGSGEEPDSQQRRPRDPSVLAARRKRLLNTILSVIARLHAGRGVLVVGTKKVRQEILEKMTIGELEAVLCQALGLRDDLERVDSHLRFGHYAALQGLNGFKTFGAAVLVGKQELPPEVLVRLGRALAYNQPEKPNEMLATRRRTTEAASAYDEYRTTERRRIQMRDGRVAHVDVPVSRWYWARLVERQRREEELVQAAGRLRSIHVDEDDERRWQTLYLVGNVVYEGLVIDHFVHAYDFEAYRTLMRVAYENGGCLSTRAMLAARDAEGKPLVESEGAQNRAEDAARAALKRRGFSTKAVPPGWCAVAVKTPGRGAAVTVWVHEGIATDPAAAALAHARAVGHDALGAEVKVRNAIATPDITVADTRAESRAERLGAAEEVRLLMREARVAIPEDVTEAEIVDLVLHTPQSPTAQRVRTRIERHVDEMAEASNDWTDDSMWHAA